MNQSIAIILTGIVVLIIMILFYYYMNWVREQYILLDKEEISEVSMFALPVWAKDAWGPTWTFLQRLNAKLSSNF
jgi:hypothetical protein